MPSSTTSTNSKLIMPVSDPTQHHEWSAKTLGSWGANLGKRWAAEAVNYADKQARITIEQVNRDRQIVEDNRANHRNFNRMMTLFGALMIGLVLTFLLTHPTILASWGIAPKLTATIQPYTFVITILLDSSLALYSFVRKY